MTDPRNIRLVVGEIRGSLERYGREELVEILTYIFKEFVVEGGTPLGSGAGAVLDARSELEGMSFSQVVTWLQTHLDLPELGLLEVAGGRVSVRAGGRLVPLDAAPAQAAPTPVAAPAPVAAPPPTTTTISSAPILAPTANAPAPAAPPAPAAKPAEEPKPKTPRLDID